MNIAIYVVSTITMLLLAIGAVIFSVHKVAGIWVLFAGIVAALLAVTLYLQNAIESKPDLKEPTFSENVKHFTFSLGEGGISVEYAKETLEKKHMNNSFAFGGYHPVDLYIEDGKLYADVKIYGGKGLPPISIKKNKLSNKPSDWDFNSNDKALEIVDSKQNPIYQFFYKTPSHIVMNGIFPYPGGLILANKKEVIMNPGLPTLFKLKRIFKYPSWKHPGVYEN